MNKLLSLTAAAMLFAFPAMGQSVLAVNGVGAVNQLNAVTIQAANTNVIGLGVIANDIDATAVGNSAGVSQTNDVAFLALNVQGGVNQANVLTVQAAQTNVAGLFVLGNEINSTAVGNAASVDQINGPLVLATANLQAGVNQVNLGTIQGAQTNVAGAVVAGNDIGATSAGNAASIASTN